ncbi:hypothetical protein BEP19_05335 [Ammoniphilus oxalaticus]|uniref:GerMN domain-containing protein n=1 Tax=Ammoniphilus oxalaticus TaxID=66863 RepID=A0A419SII7_9BACL|nr:GerMN domain-containing protein [Ammoniphilus oxalaticus]RKD23854.1 hypothetical protein BEP19_05335 [Ammoniphilus oxalaticus]
MSRKLTVLIPLTLSVAMLSGCGLFGPEQSTGSKPVDPPRMSKNNKPQGPSEEVTLSLIGDQGKADTDDPAKAMVEDVATPVYLMDPEGFVVPITVQLPKAEGPAKQVLNYMVKGGPIEDVKPDGFTALLPKGTVVQGVNIKDGVATVDFSDKFGNYEAKDEQKIVDAITFALTSFESVKEVKIWINGHPQEVMPVDGTPISSLSRADGINKELAANVKMGETTPITLYFQGEMANKETYFVPVTRLISRTDDKAMATVNELIRGPKQGANLFSSILPTTKVLDVKIDNGVATVNLDEKILDYNDGKANPLAMDSILLSLTENADVGQVQFMVNGKTNVTAGDKDYSKPVSRPTQMNPGKM